MKVFCVTALLLFSMGAGEISCEAAAALSAKTLENDLSFYRKTSRDKKLDYNDSYYILIKIEEKYKATKVNMAPLKKELAKLKAKEKAGLTGAPVTARPAAANAVTGLTIDDNAADTRIVITADGVERSNYFVMRDPDPAQPPKLILDLYGVDEKLSEKDKNRQFKEGVFLSVRAAQFEKEPDKIVRIVTELRQEKPYKIKNENDKWFIIVEKEPQKQEAKLPAAAPSVPAAASGIAASIPAANKSSAPANYTIDTGDVLSISVYPAEELSRESVVQIDGTISMPLIGQTEVKGMTTKKLEETLSKKLEKYVSNPQVSIAIRQFSRRQIFITGEVRSVGAYSYKENLRLLEFISQVGGFTDAANRREVKIYRGPATKRQIFTINVEDLVLSGDFSKDFLLEPGDIIEVQKGQAKVSLLGDVRSPGYYDYKENLKLIELISLAGGFTDSANISEVSVIRDGGGAGKEKKVTKVDLKKILSGKDKDMELKSGDTVYIPKKALTSATNFLGNILPWLSLIVLVMAIRGGI